MESTLLETPSEVIKASPNTGEVFDTIELPFYYLGLTTPLKRFLGVSALVLGTIYVTKPKALFQANQTARPWAVTSNSPAAVYIPWWMYAVVLGGAAAIFV